MKLVKIKCNGEMIDLDEPLNLRNIKKVLTNKYNSANIQYLYSWNYEGSTILCYGCKDGSAGNENKHDLPPEGIKHIKSLDNSDTQLLFGDIFMLMKQKSLSNFDTSDYGLFYSVCFDGFGDCVSDDDSVSDDCLSENSEGNEFIVNGSDSSDQNEEYMGDSDELYGSGELDEDMNEY
jgi:hypothetical protein